MCFWISGYCGWGDGFELVPVLLELVLVLLFEPKVLAKGEVPTGVVVLLAGWPMPAPLPPLMVFISEMGS